MIRLYTIEGEGELCLVPGLLDAAGIAQKRFLARRPRARDDAVTAADGFVRSCHAVAIANYGSPARRAASL